MMDVAGAVACVVLASPVHAEYVLMVTVRLHVVFALTAEHEMQTHSAEKQGVTQQQAAAEAYVVTAHQICSQSSKTGTRPVNALWTATGTKLDRMGSPQHAVVRRKCVKPAGVS